MASTLTKHEAGYVEHSRRTEHCGTCSMFKAKERACTLVKGEVAPQGWCRHWEKEDW